MNFIRKKLRNEVKHSITNPKNHLTYNRNGKTKFFHRKTIQAKYKIPVKVIFFAITQTTKYSFAICF